MVANPEDRVSRGEAHFLMFCCYCFAMFKICLDFREKNKRIETLNMTLLLSCIPPNNSLPVSQIQTVYTLGPVVQSIVDLTTWLRCQLVKYVPTTLSNTLLFLLEK